jgi:uncharacterized protein YkwD
MTAKSRRSRFGLLFAGSIGLLVLALLSGCTPESASELKTYEGINQIRAENGLPPLTPDPALLEIARLRSKDMAANNYFSHTPPDGCDYVCLFDQHGMPYAWAGENIAWNSWGWDKTASVAVDMWRNSPPHFRNITDCHYERVATGVVKSGDRVYYTMLFEGNRAC